MTNKAFGKEEYIGWSHAGEFDLNAPVGLYVKKCPKCHTNIWLDKEQLFELAQKAGLKPRVPIRQRIRKLRWPRLHVSLSWTDEQRARAQAQLDGAIIMGADPRIIDQLKGYVSRFGRNGVEEMIRLRQQGFSLRAVAKVAGCSHQWVGVIEKLYHQVLQS